MAYIGKSPTAAPLTSSDVADGIITNAKLAQDIISAETELAEAPASTDEFLISDAGTLKRLDASYIGGSNSPCFWVTRNSVQSISQSTHTKIQFDTEKYDADNVFDNSTNHRFTVPSGEGGKYLLTYQTAITLPTNELHYAQLKVNGTQINYHFDGGGNVSHSNSIGGTVVLDLSASDYVEVYMYHTNTATNLDNGFGTQYGTCYFGGFKLV